MILLIKSAVGTAMFHLSYIRDAANATVWRAQIPLGITLPA
jgi:hypothetical protein